MGTKAALGRALKAGHQRVDGGIGQARAADQEAQQHAHHDGDAEARHGHPQVRQAWPAMTPRNSTSF
jgi:hypothetical protein